jgi:hypothetical protein
MIIKRLIVVGVALFLGLPLGSCGGAAGDGGFSGYVADHWPHWAGGLPADAPPRPGAPGYNDFIAHGGADPSAAKEAATGQGPAAAQKTAPETAGQRAQVTPVTTPSPTGEAPPPPDANPPEDPSVVKGGLY